MRGVRKSLQAWAVRGQAMDVTVASMEDTLPSAADLLRAAGHAPTAPSATLAAVVTGAFRVGGGDITASLAAHVLVGDQPVPITRVLPTELKGALPVTLRIVPGAVRCLTVLEGKKGVFAPQAATDGVQTLGAVTPAWQEAAKGALAGRVASQ